MAEKSSRTRMWSAPEPPKGPAERINELKDLVVGYAKQETVDPLKTLGRYLAFGMGGSVAIGAGLVFALLALLRGLQQLDVFNPVPEIRDGLVVLDGRFTWAPYLITATVGVLLSALFLRRLVVATRRTPR